MPLQLSLGTVEDIHEFTSLVFTAYPQDQPYLKLIIPGFGAESQERINEGIQDSAAIQLARWKANPSERWVKVVDTDTGKIAG